MGQIEDCGDVERNKMKVQVKVTAGEYNSATITTEPYAAAMAVLREWDNAPTSKGRVFRGVRFTNDRHREMGHDFAPHLILWNPETMTKEEAKAGWAAWEAMKAAGGGEMDVPEVILEKILAKAAAIESAVAAVTSRPPTRTYRCAGAKDGCHATVSENGGYCRRCAHDEFDN
jgi:hypothetical protein